MAAFAFASAGASQGDPNMNFAPTGKLAVLFPGMGAVATTTIAGVMLARRGLGAPIGSFAEYGVVDDVSGGGSPATKTRDLVPLASLDQLVFGGWDIFEDDALAAARHADVLTEKHLDLIAPELAAVRPMKAVFYPEYVKRLHGTWVKEGATKADMVEQLRQDIRTFIKEQGADRAVAVWTGSTETYIEPTAVHATIKSFEKGLLTNDPAISAAQLYAWACLKERVPYANGSPNLGVEFPAAQELAHDLGVAIAGKDFKTGQTLMKTVIAPGFRARNLGVRGWYSTNILGNRDGEVLDDPESFKSKEVSKLGVLDSIFEPENAPDLYGNMAHKVRIDYYPPRGDQKEGWDNIDFFGWLGYNMQMKIDLLCRDSILAAPIVLDLALFLDLAQRSGQMGTQEWLSFYFKSPMHDGAGRPVHDLFAQLDRMKATLRTLSRVRALASAAE